MKVLYIEDEPVNIRAIQLVTQHLGYELITAEDAAKGLELARQHPDLILLDISLPGTNGLILAKQIRKENLTMPIIAVTAHAMTGFREKCLQAGCVDYLVKPFAFKDMGRLLKEYEAQLTKTSSGASEWH
jgi:CheY-like chemotaxis protein